MHDTAAAFGAAFFRCYADAIGKPRILEIGAGDVNGALRGCAPYDAKYTGVDLTAGPGVDVVLEDPYAYPFQPATFDIVVSSSCFEHDPLFWLSFAEMCRVVRPGGFIYLNVPSNGPFHRYPTDNWRFYPDSGLALAGWGRRNGHDVRLTESLIGRRRRDVWNDCVMVFGKGDTPRPLHLLGEIFPSSFNIRVGEQATISNYCEPTEDMTLRAWLIEKLRAPTGADGGENRSLAIEALIVALAEREVALGGTERASSKRSAAAEDQINALRGEIESREAALARIEVEAGAREAEIAGLRAELAARDSTLARGELLAAEGAADVIALRADLATREAALSEANLHKATLEATLERVRLELTEEVARAVAAKAALDSAQADVEARDFALAEAGNRCAELAAALAKAETEAVAMRDERDRAIQTAAASDQISEAAQSAIDILRTRLAHGEGEAAKRVAAAENAYARICEERDLLSRQREELSQECELGARERREMAAERLRISAERDRLSQEREELSRECELGARERQAVAAERDRISAERDRLSHEREELSQACELGARERQEVAAERDRISVERDLFAAEGIQWFDAAVLAVVSGVGHGRTRRSCRLGRYMVQICSVRGRGSAMQRADQARDAHQWGRAARFYLDALDQHPRNRTAIWVQLGHALKESAKPKEAEFAYRRAIELDNRNTNALVALGELMRRHGRGAEAMSEYRRALDLPLSAELRAFVRGELAALGDGPDTMPVPTLS